MKEKQESSFSAIENPLKQILEGFASLNNEQIERMLENGGDRSLMELLVTKGGLDEETVLRAISASLGYPLVTTLKAKLHTIDGSKAPINYLKKNLLAPLSLESGTLEVATADPFRREALDDLKRLLGARRTKTVLSPKREIVKVLNQLYDLSQQTSERFIEKLDEETGGEHFIEEWNEVGEVEDLLDSTSEAPVIRLVNYILTQAIKNRASDIHLEPYQDEIRVRYRIDGILYQFLSPPKRLHAAIVSRIKVMSDLNIAEKRLPQDGRIQIKMADRDIDIRVSIIPTFFGERIVLRLLDKKSSFLTVAELGMRQNQIDVIETLLQMSYGIVLVTGPTGSGKTTTLYSALSRISSLEKNIITIEDPIEYQLRGVAQIQVSPKIGLTFASGLRSILRHDPDVIMVGEIRDLDTVEIAVQASLTGHLVFSTLHTNDAVSAITRLLDMGVEPFLITASVIAVVAQRLVRRICPYCQEPYEPPPALIEKLGINSVEVGKAHFLHGKGCEHCFHTGYRGRSGLYELLTLDDTIRRQVMRGADEMEIRHSAQEKGLFLLRQDGVAKALSGETTLEEVLRVTQG
jgi:general secretion pathway protein E